MISSSISDEGAITNSYKIIILGMAAAGKTKLLTRYRYGNYVDEGLSTTMVDFIPIRRNNIRFNYYDTAGQQKYRSILNLYFKGSDAAILVYSVNSMQSFEELTYYYKQVQSAAPSCKIYLVGCKSDLKKQVTKQVVKSKFEAVKYYETSAKLNEGVIEAFQGIQTDLLLLKKQNKIKRFSLQTSRTSTRGRKEHKCCEKT